MEEALSAENMRYVQDERFPIVCDYATGKLNGCVDEENVLKQQKILI